MNVGILGIGSFLPEHVRKNDWWPRAHVDSWREKRVNRMTRGSIPNDVPLTDGVRLVASEMERMASDPFDGCVERRVMDPKMTSGDMEVIAAERAIRAAGLDPKDIDVLLLQSMGTDHVIANNACAVHERLGLRQQILSLETQGVCNAFLLQLNVARQMIQGGSSKTILIVQSAPLSRLMEPHEPYSVWFGDGATAAVIGPVSDGRGILAMSSRTDGSVHRALVGAIDANTPWYEDGNVRIRALEPLLGRKMLLTSADLGKQAVDDVLTEAKLSTRDVDFFACHQASSWFRNAAQKLIGLEHARTADTYPWAGNLAGANLPLVMEVAQKDHLVKDGDLVAMYAGGGGMTWSAALVRWGR